MQTQFSLVQLARPETREAESILRRCVHCGFCLATCPTYVELGNELDSPRGRIYLIKDMFENDRPAGAEVATHIDRCLSCLSCMTTCPSGVDYMHLVDMARVHVEKTYRRAPADRLVRALLAHVLPRRDRLRMALLAARLARPLGGLLVRLGGPFERVAAMLALSGRMRGSVDTTVVVSEPRRGRVVLLEGCAQPVLDPGINAAVRRLLARFGVETATVRNEGCCGALSHHMGREEDARGFAQANIDAWTRETEVGVDAVLTSASGCGTVVKDYGHLFAHEPAYAEKAAAIGRLARDVTEYLTELDLPRLPANGVTVAYHSACSMQHGQRLTVLPKLVLERAGFTVRDVPEGHLCCGSAGTYNVLQPRIAARLLKRKVRNIETTGPDVIATGNIGCITQIGTGTAIPILHTAELLDWAYGGPAPTSLGARRSEFCARMQGAQAA